jgi:phage baseplate assembly protein W
MRPDFGCGIHELVFETMDSTTLQRVRSVVDEALTRYEARIEIVGIRVDPEPETQGAMLIELEYRVRLTNQVDNLVYPFYFREGGNR